MTAALPFTLLYRFTIYISIFDLKLAAANVNSPIGEVQSPLRSWTISDNDQIKKAYQYRPLIVASNPRTGSVVRLSDVADVRDSVEDAHIYALSNGKRAVIGIVWRQPGANIIQTVDNVLATFLSCRHPSLWQSRSTSYQIAPLPCGLHSATSRSR